METLLHEGDDVVSAGSMVPERSVDVDGDWEWYRHGEWDVHLHFYWHRYVDGDQAIYRHMDGHGHFDGHWHGSVHYHWLLWHGEGLIYDHLPFQRRGSHLFWALAHGIMLMALVGHCSLILRASQGHKGTLARRVGVSMAIRATEPACCHHLRFRPAQAPRGVIPVGRHQRIVAVLCMGPPSPGRPHFLIMTGHLG
jgi:hypothetical protein